MLLLHSYLFQYLRHLRHSVIWALISSLLKKVAQSCPTLCDPMDCSLPGSSVHGVFQARILEWVAISFSRGSSQPRARTRVSHIVDRCFTVWGTREVYWIGDTIQSSHPLPSPSPPAFHLSQHQGLFQWVSSLHQVAKVLEFQLQHQSFQWIFRIDFL